MHILCSEEVKKEAEKKAKKKAKKKGKKEGKKEVAIRLLENNFPIQKIIELTDLNESEILKLR